MIAAFAVFCVIGFIVAVSPDPNQILSRAAIGISLFISTPVWMALSLAIKSKLLDRWTDRSIEKLEESGPPVHRRLWLNPNIGDLIFGLVMGLLTMWFLFAQSGV